MFRKILIANRGEIAVRVIRTCKQMGIQTVAVFSEADRESLHVKLADESVCVGPASPAKSYLNASNIISAALVSGADAIHPGYGFLAENKQFAEICQSHHITFIGPSVEALGTLGDKAQARALAERLHLPVIPGSAILRSVAEGLKLAHAIGYPVMIKAAGGGGGKGMRLAFSAAELERNIPMAQAEAESAFGDDRIYLEKYLVEPRHIEVQILGDRFGNLVAVGERECSLQRQHQKIIEEAPSPAVSPSTRKKIQELAVKLGKGVRYVGAGTVEFLRDRDGKFYFIEANARIQVEHPVTEMVSGLDLVREQIRVSQGEKLSMKQDDIQIRGHAIECRVNAEDPETFEPCAGTLETLHWPGGLGVRVDSHVCQGDKIPPFYDSMVGKIITWGKDRKEALARMRCAMDECRVEGIKTNLPLHRQLLRNSAVLEGSLHVVFVENLLSEKVLV